MSDGPPTPPASRWSGFLRSSFGIGLATLVVTIPLILVVPRKMAWLVAFVVLCLYPVLDAPRNVARRSWWLGAVLSTFVWLGVMGILVAAADARERLRESAMVFMVPWMMFPVVLLISGLVRLERRLRGQPRESGVRIAAVLGGVACLLMVGVPIVLNSLPILTERATGNTPANTSYAGAEAVVVEADAQHVSIRGPGPPSYQLTPETRFGFLGPGRSPTHPPPGPSWLKPGQKVQVDYVFRDGVAHAQHVSIWIDRKGCAGDERWSAMATPAEDAALAGSTWEGWRGAERERGGDQPMVVELLPAGRIAYTSGPSSAGHTDGGWRQKGSAVLIQVNDCYAEYAATIDGDQMTGEMSNEMGFRQPWTARRIAGTGTSPPPP